MIKICIVHYNTPKLTECLIRSINKYTPNSIIYIFDNSDKNPFTYKVSNVVYIDNTQGQIINFNKWLENYPNKNFSYGRFNGWASAKHCYSIEKCMEIIDDNFILLDSDILLKKDISSIWDEQFIYVASVVSQPKSSIKRVIPFICFINTKLCKKYNVHFFDENYMHGLRYTKKVKNADMYDTGAGFYISSKNYSHKEIDWTDYIVHYKGGSWHTTHESYYGKSISDTEWLLLNKELWNADTKINKKVVYTCITGGYDSLKENIYVNEGFDYVCFTDNPELKSDLWIIKQMPNDVDGLSNVKKQRCIKINPHKYLSEYDLSVWVDGSVTVKGNINKLLDEVNDKNAVIYIPQHPQRNCIYKEADACIRLKKDTVENIIPQINEYKKEGFPENYGLVQSNIIIRRHNDQNCINLMEKWWNELSQKSHRDQLSFNYALWKTPDVNIELLPKLIYNSEYFFWDKHHPIKPIKTNSQKPLSLIKQNQEPAKIIKTTGLDMSQVILSKTEPQPSLPKKQNNIPKTKSLRVVRQLH